jgi:hypothetical protein
MYNLAVHVAAKLYMNTNSGILPQKAIAAAIAGDLIK